MWEEDTVKIVSPRSVGVFIGNEFVKASIIDSESGKFEGHWGLESGAQCSASWGTGKPHRG